MVVFFNDWSDLQCGQVVNAVATMKIFDIRQRSHMMTTVVGDFPFQFCGMLPEGKCWYTFIEAVVDGVMPTVKLGKSPDTGVLVYDPPSWDTIHGLIEACSGMGALGFGARAAGFTPQVGTDHNGKMLQLWERIHHCPVVESEVCNPQTAVKIWQHFPYPACLGAGYSCQPYSTLGDRGSQFDPRSRSLPGTLRLAHYVRAQIIVLECVVGASVDPWCRETLQAFAQDTGFFLREAVLHLHDLWPSKRSRWWVVLSSPFVGPIDLMGSDFLRDAMRVCQVFPAPCHWPTEDEHQLSLSTEEQVAFKVSDDQASPYLLNVNGTCPCALHAWGSQLSPCPCGCRSQRLAESRISEKGLFGVITRSALALDGSFHYRHLHPSELASLVGMDPVLHFDDDMKLGLCALGQVASPLQSVWVFGQIAGKIDKFQFGQVKRNPFDHLLAYKTWLIMRCRLVWPEAKPVAKNLERAIQMWQPAHDLTLHQLMDLSYWKALRTEHLSLAYVLDAAFDERLESIIRESEPGIPPSIATWIEDQRLENFDVQVSRTDATHPVQVKVPPGHLVSELVAAEEALLGTKLAVSGVTDSQGIPLDPPEVLTPDCMLSLDPTKDLCPTCVSPPLLMLADGVAVESDDTPVLPSGPMVAEDVRTCRPLPGMPVLPLHMPPPHEGDSVACRGSIQNMNMSDSVDWLLDSHASTFESTSGECRLLPRMPESSVLLPPHPEGVIHDVPISNCPPAVSPGATTHAMVISVSGECGLLPCMPLTTPLPLPPLPEGDDVSDSHVAGECGLLPRMPLDSPLPLPPLPEGDDVSGSHVAGECGLLPRMPLTTSLPLPPHPEGDDVPDSQVSVLPSDAFADGLLEVLMSPGVNDHFLVDEPAATVPDSPECDELPATLPTKRKLQLPEVHFACVASPLCNLQADALLRLQGPMPTTDAMLNGLMMQRITSGDRQRILQNQHVSWADDEVRWQLTQIELQFQAAQEANCCSMPFDKVVTADPLMVHGWVQSRFDGLDAWIHSHFGTSVCLALTVCTNAHWTPVLIWVRGPYLQVQTWDEESADHTLVENFALYVAACTGLEPHFVKLNHCFVGGHCGVLAIAYFRHVLLHDVLPVEVSQVEAIHSILRLKFQQMVQSNATVPRPWMWAQGPSQADQATQDLKPILEAQGVPADQTDLRARSAIRAIGATAILKALTAKNPWRQLKVLGNQVKFQFVLPSELELKIAATAGQKRVSHNKPGKKPRKTFDPPAPVDLDPSKLVIQPGIFECNGQSLRQLQLQQIGPLAEGVILCKALEAEPYLRSGKPVSKGPLALLILHGPGEKWSTTLTQSQVTTPCQCIANQEPLLIDMTMVQIGGGVVTRKLAQATVPIDMLDVATVKLVAYKDELPCDWAVFADAPVKNIIQQIPLLTLCQEDHCTCPAWHNHEKIHTKTPVLDVWRRQFLRSGFKPDHASSACMYSVCLRVPQCLLEPLLQQSGVSGIYVEPRSIDAKDVDPRFMIVWLPRMSKAEIAHHKQLNPTAIGLARVGDRLGLRTLSSHAADLHSSIRPDSTYLPQGPRQSWTIGPMPFGSDRASITKALKTLPWEAKVLQPTGTVIGKGNLWAVQSVADPPATVLQMTHGDVVVSRVKTNVADSKSASNHTVASPETLALCGTAKVQAAPAPSNVPQVNKGTDVWTVAPDPWANWHKSTGPAVSDTIKQIEAKVETAVLAKLPQTNAMEQDHLPDRITTLESQVQGLMQKQQHLEVQVTDNAAKHTTQLNALQSQIHGQAEANQQNMAAMFESQMAQIRSLLAKRKSDDSDL